MINYVRVLATACAILVAAETGRAEDYGLRVPPGFKVTLYADETLANDIYAMTLDKQGRVVVTSQGWIKILHDTQGVGKADKATVFAKTTTGGMGLCFDGDDLYFCGDGWFSRYRDSKGRGEADGPPERFVPLSFGEHGGHAMRRGPDGSWYVLGGNSSNFNRKEHATLPNSSIRDVEAGALLRLTPDCKGCEVIAHGFRNPYDFDFNAAGDLFTYDSDNEEDFFLPWYAPTRVYHIGYGQHHGWRLNGSKRSWGRPDYYPDTVDILWPVGRGSPTGVACYRHDQFPEHYRDGLFALDWTFGKVYFFPLEADGSTYKTRPEVFLESVGTSGFDPTDVVVAPDGSLFVSMGGRGTRGAVYHIEYVGDGKTPVKKEKESSNNLDAVLLAHQPLDAWSRAQWMPLARKLGACPFAAVVADHKRFDADRMRAIEILTELFGGLPPAVAKQAAKTSSPLVRARAAWSLGRTPCEGFIDILCGLAKDKEPRVRCFALASLADHANEVSVETARVALLENLADEDKRVRQAASHLMALLKEPVWKKLEPLSPQGRISALLAGLEHDPQHHPPEEILYEALAILGEINDADLRLQVIRVIMLALGDFELKDPRVEAYSAYSLHGSLNDRGALVQRILKAVRPLFPSGVETLDLETARLLAMLEDDDAELPRKVAALWTAKSAPTRDMHYLIVYSRLRGPRDKNAAGQVARAILALDRKLGGQEQRNKQNWSIRLAEVLVPLLQHDPGLADEMLKRPELVSAGHVLLAANLDPEHRERAARLFLEAVQKDSEFAWSVPLVELLGQLPADDTLPVFREQFSNYGLRDALLLRFAKQPKAIQPDWFRMGLESQQHSVVAACLSALTELGRDRSPRNLISLLRLLQRLEQEPKEKALREKVVALINRQTDENFAIKEEATDPAALKRAYQPVFDWFKKRHPDLVAAMNGGNGEDAAAWNKLLETVDWDKGDAKRGAAIFRDRACITCHAGPTRLGPDLAGVATRFSRTDLFTAIFDPSRDVAPPYRVTVLETKDGKSYSGIVAYESAETVILQTGAATTMRIATKDIDARRPSNKSLMPDGLLKDLKPNDLASVYRYLQTLKSPQTGDSPSR